MIPDLPVLALKLRDYVFWLLPMYGLAVAVTAGLSAWIAARDPAGYQMLGTLNPPASSATLPGRWLLWHLAGRPNVGRTRPALALQVWMLTLSTAVTPLALGLTLVLQPAVALLRLGSALLLCSILTMFVAGLTRGSRPPVATPVAPAALVDSGPRAGRQATLPALWWAQTRLLFDQTSTPLLLSAVAGGLFTAWRPARLAAGWLVQQGPLAAFPAALAAIALPFPAGTEIPLVRGLQTYDAPLAAILAVLLGAPLLNWTCLREIGRQSGPPTLVVYLLGGLGLVVLLSIAAAVVFGPILLLEF